MSVCLRIASTTVKKPQINHIIRNEWKRVSAADWSSPSETDKITQTRDRLEPVGYYVRSLFPPSSDSGVALDFCHCGRFSMYPRGSANKVYFRSGGVRHPPFRSFPVRSHSLGSNLRLVSIWASQVVKKESVHDGICLCKCQRWRKTRVGGARTPGDGQRYD